MSRWKDPATGRSYPICSRTGASYHVSSGCELDRDDAGDDQGEPSHAMRLEHAFVDRSHLRRHKKRWDSQRDTNHDHDEGVDAKACPEWIGRVMKVRCRAISLHSTLHPPAAPEWQFTWGAEIRLSTGLGKSYVHSAD
jgi:hypothetical protein